MELTKTLTASEKLQHQNDERIIEKGLKTFYEVGCALQRIRDNRTYRETHATFEAYLKDRWDIDRTYGHRHIQAAKVVGNLLTIGNTVPATESQCRPLVELEPDNQREVWQRVLDSGDKITAKRIKQEADAYLGNDVDEPEPEPKAKVKSAPKTKVQELYEQSTTATPKSKYAKAPADEDWHKHEFYRKAGQDKSEPWDNAKWRQAKKDRNNQRFREMQERQGRGYETDRQRKERLSREHWKDYSDHNGDRYDGIWTEADEAAYQEHCRKSEEEFRRASEKWNQHFRRMFGNLFNKMELELTEREATMATGMLKAGYHAISKDVHPDKGGQTEDMMALNKVNEMFTGLVDRAVVVDEEQTSRGMANTTDNKVIGLPNLVQTKIDNDNDPNVDMDEVSADLDDDEAVNAMLKRSMNNWTIG